MTRVSRPALLVLVALTAVSLHAQQQRQFFASVTNRSGPVTNLVADDVQVTESGQECKLLKLEPIDWPTKVTVLVDNGSPSTAFLANLRAGLQGLFKEIPDNVETSLLSLSPQPRWIVRPTTDRDKLVKGVDLVTPDSQVSKFFEGLAEAADRIDKDKTKTFPMIVLFVSEVASRAVPLEYELDRLEKRVRDHAVTIHVVLLSTGTGNSTSGGGYLQRQLGQSLAQLSGGRFEQIATGTRLTTVLPEIGGDIARSESRQSHQYRITCQAPAGASPNGAGNILVKVARPGAEVGLSRDGHLP